MSTSPPSLFGQKVPKDHWNPTDYSLSASFVPQLATRILQWLNPRKYDKTLDIGCGDGQLSAQILDSAPRTTVIGVDSSPNLIAAAKEKYHFSRYPALSFHLKDVTTFEKDVPWLPKELNAYNKNGVFNKVFSNAALHWIFRDPSYPSGDETNEAVLGAIHRLLQPGGNSTFVFEMGGHGNVADAHAALIAALVHQGLTIHQARKACPWFFPSEDQMRQMLYRAGFVVEKMETEYRPTRLAQEGGLEGWIRLMGAQMLAAVEKEKGESAKEDVVKEVCDVLESVCRRDDGACWLGYVRLRGVAKKVDQG